jgi:hypothetical protein
MNASELVAKLFRANALNCRGIVGAGNLEPLVRTSWWSGAR